MDTEKGAQICPNPMAWHEIKVGICFTHLSLITEGRNHLYANVQGKRPAQSPEHFVDFVD
jgi:hypothetical protein